MPHWDIGHQALKRISVPRKEAPPKLPLEYEHITQLHDEFTKNEASRPKF